MLRQLVSKTRSVLSVAGPSSSCSQLFIAGEQAPQLTTLLSFRPISTSSILQQELNPAPSPKQNNEPMPPWTPTAELEKRKTYTKRMGYMLQVIEKEKELAAQAELQRPEFGPGDLLELKLSVPENKRRTTIFKGICIARRNRGWNTSFTLRNFIGNSGGIERTFPLYSPHVQEIKVLAPSGKKQKYRRSKLYYLRDVQPKEYRVQ